MIKSATRSRFGERVRFRGITGVYAPACPQQAGKTPALRAATYTLTAPERRID